MNVENSQFVKCASVSDNRLCAMCSENEFKYKCPKCEVKTCSLSCCNDHKAQFDCTGICDTITYCRKENYSMFFFQKDYRLLEEIDRENACREKQLLSLSHRNTGRIRRRNQLVKLANEYGVTLRLAPTLMLSRTKVNKTRVHIQKDEPKIILWSIEFSLMSSEEASDVTCITSHSKSIRLVVHDQEQLTRLCTIWSNHILNVSSERQDALITYYPSGSPPFGKISSWLHSKTSRPSDSTAKFYFYVNVQENGVEQVSKDIKTTTTLQNNYVKVFSTRRLIDILTIPGFIIHEMPTIYVSKKDLTNKNTNQ
ncbi:cGMP-dependent protein kinase 1, variant 4 [Schistosoma haematobium]|uniref:Putative box C/D snoRNA protein n=1 Tax=Schistosoma haematobium TaxID=6185 RepID=A0A094ZFS8_SCHHA|nr:cGMP-dependent protein kinase 1, variant 4 [Schistosoma haematobium]KAH9581590.1 cGMP-dependent protein kinase 1, variant 4 [Schistosoma haematobium]